MSGVWGSLFDNDQYDSKRGTLVELALWCSKPNDNEYWTQSKFLLYCQCRADQLYEPPLTMDNFRHPVSFRLSPIWSIKKWLEEDRKHIGLTIGDHLNEKNKREVTLKEVQPLHEIPLGFPHEINLHSEGKDVVPSKHRTGYDCGESQKNLISAPIADWPSKLCQWWSDQGNATLGELENALSPVSQQTMRE